ncbi:response regulator transcription factor [Microlunatus flavus]|uniref:response regulator transcription factor n=1 Tax=Microlunatus flavus TaxID=1036181 RepID=UPI000B852B91|nr:response regulator transcription factor [Microlunatus flavus]
MSVVVCDDHDVVWVGLLGAARAASGRPVRLRGHATDAGRLLALVEQQPPDVVVLDLALGDGSDPGETVARVIAAGSRVLVYSVLDSPRLIRRALAAGAHGLSHKSEPVHLTLDKIRQVASGQILLSPDVLSMIDGDADFVRARLSDREREVLVLYVSGVEIAQIAAQLFVTENSAREYLRRIRAKYTEAERPASTKVDLLRRAIEDGIVPPIEPR